MSDQIKHLFDELVALSMEERSRALEAESDASVRLEVAKLLEAHDRLRGDTEFFATPEVADDGPDPLIGTAIGSYEITDVLGRGGMGIVYLAQQESPIRRQVALKLIKPGMDSHEVIRRFEIERQALALLDHPGVARVLDAGATERGRPYFVMELVNGKPITEYCDNRRLSIEDRLGLFMQACRAVQHAHQKGVIHRDLKPSNILVADTTDGPSVKVIDFGLARALDSGLGLDTQTDLTRIDQIIGTLNYMSPEQATEGATGVDTRTDVYSLGAVFYELLSGTTPLGGEDVIHETLRAIREDDPLPPSKRVSESTPTADSVPEKRSSTARRLTRVLKGDLDCIAIKALEKDPPRRYESVESLASDVQRCLNEEAIEARPPSLSYQLRKAFRKHRARFITAGLMLGLLLAGLFGTGTMWYLASKAEKSVRISEVQAREEAVYATFQLANARWEGNRVREARQLLNEIPPKYREFEWYYCYRLFLGSDVTLYGGTDARSYPKGLTGVCFSPDGRRIALASRNTIKILDAATGQELQTLEAHQRVKWGYTPSVRSLSYSPNGAQLASGSSDGTIKIWDLDSGVAATTLKCFGAVETLAFSHDGRRLASAGSGDCIKVWDPSSGVLITFMYEWRSTSVSLSPDGRQLAAACDDSTVRIWDANTGDEVTTFNLPTRADAIAFSPDGTVLASGGWDHMIRLLDAKTGQEQRTLRGHSQRITSLKFTPDGTRLASGSCDRTIRVWDVRSGGELKTFKGHSQEVISLSFTPEGTRLASESRDERIKLWDCVTFDNLRTLKVGPQWPDFDFSPDGTRLATGGGGTIRLWDTATGTELVRRKAHPVISVAFGPGGNLIASGGNDGTIGLWAADTLEEVALRKAHTGPVLSIAFSPDGKRIVSAANETTIKVWDAASAIELKTLQGPNKVFCVSFDPSGTRIAAGGFDQPITLFDWATGQELRTFEGHDGSVLSLAFSTDGTRLATGGSDHTIRLWDTKTGQELRRLEGHTDSVTSLSFNRDGSRLASTSPYDTIKLWSVSTGKELMTLAEPGAASVRFNTNGTVLAWARQDGTIRMADAPLNREVITLRHRGPVDYKCFSPDGTRLYSQSKDERIVWEVPSGRELEDAEWYRPPYANRLGRWLATHSYEDVLLVDKEFKNTPREKAYRVSKAQPKSWWHEEQAKEAIDAENWFAAAFHSAWLLKLRPESKAAYDQLRASYDQLDEQTAEVVPKVVRDALAMPE